MAQTIKLKRSSVASNIPTTGQLSLGEIAVNTNDGKLFIKKDDGAESIVEIGGANTLNELTDVVIGGSPLVSGQVLTYNGTSWINDDADYVELTGDTMTGVLQIVLPTASANTHIKLTAPAAGSPVDVETEFTGMLSYDSTGVELGRYFAGRQRTGIQIRDNVGAVDSALYLLPDGNVYATAGAPGTVFPAIPTLDVHLANKKYVDDTTVSITGDTMTGDLTAPSVIVTGTQGFQWESGRSRITHNDGGGNCQIRFGHKFDVTDVFTADNSGAVRILSSIDSVQNGLLIEVANNATVTAGDTVTWGTTFSVNHDSLTWDGNQLATESYVDTADDNFVDLTSNQTVAGLKTFSNTLSMNANISFNTNLQILNSGGSLSTPSYAFSGDGNTGMTQNGFTENIHLVTSGVSRLQIESNGTLNVAGTTNYETLVTADDDVPNKKYVDDTHLTAGSKVLLESLTASTSASLDFTTGIDNSTYEYYVIEFTNFVPATNGDTFYLRVSEDGGSTWAAASGDYRTTITNLSGVPLATINVVSNLTTRIGCCGDVKIYGAGSTTAYKRFLAVSAFLSTASGDVDGVFGSRYQKTFNAINAFQLVFFSGNITIGTAKLYGIVA